MKTLFLVILILVIVFFGIQLFLSTSNSKIEKYPYQVIDKRKGFEIREYESRLFSKVVINSNEYEVASRKGFSALAGYIFGGNQENKKISMTSPVTMSLDKTDSMTMMFMVPKKYSRENLPQPKNPSISFEEMPSQRVAVIEFGGWANSKRLKKQQEKLLQLLVQSKLKHNNKFYFLGYNPPYEIFNRKNEIIAVLADD